MSTDRELLELAAKAAGLKINKKAQAARDAILNPETASLWIADGSTAWNPWRDNGNAFCCVVILISSWCKQVWEIGHQSNQYTNRCKPP